MGQYDHIVYLIISDIRLKGKNRALGGVSNV